MAQTRLVQSLARGLDILRLVAESDSGLRLNEIASAMGLKAPTAHNLLRTLLAKGFLVRRGGAPHYALGPAALALAEGLYERRLMRLAADAVRGLAERFPSATVVFSEPISGELVVRLRMSPERPGSLQRPLGQTLNPYTSASGLAHMAFCTEEERGEILQRRSFDEYGGHLWRTMDALDAFIRDVRTKGFAALRRPRREVFPVAAPVFGPRSRTVAAIGASAPWEGLVDKKRREVMIAAVVDAASGLSSVEPAGEHE